MELMQKNFEKLFQMLRDQVGCPASVPDRLAAFEYGLGVALSVLADVVELDDDRLERISQSIGRNKTPSGSS